MIDTIIALKATKAITQHLMLGDFSNVKRCCEDAMLPDTVSAWALATINEPLGNQQKLKLDFVTRTLYDGWAAYYQGDYAGSLEKFFHILDYSPCHGSGVGLGIAKVCTRLGLWDTAKQWLLHDLPYARQHNELFSQSQCYGALGEVYLRAGHNKLAYECFGNAFYVLPRGSSQRERQYNYQASALMRTGNEDQAEQCLMSALYLAEGKQVDSVWHSLARLQFLWLQQNKTDSVIHQYASYLRHKPQQGIAEGFLMMGQAFLEERLNNKAQAIACTEQAYICFKAHFPIEAYWANKLLGMLKGEDKPEQQASTMSVRAPQRSRYLIEAEGYGLKLPNQGFAPLNHAQSLAELWQARLLFFI